MSYRTAVYGPEHRESVLRLQQHLWSPDVAKNDRYLAWKYEQNPFSPGPPLIVLVLEGETVVAMHGAFASPYVGADGQPIHGLWSGDLVVAPEHRRRGVVRAVQGALFQEARDRGFRCLMNASSGRLSRGFYLSGGWKMVDVIQALQRPARHGTDPVESHVAFSNQVRPEAMAALSASVNDPLRIGSRKDPDYFRWRFANPLCHYRFFYHDAGAGQPPRGYMVLHTHGPEHDTGLHIVDWDADSPAVWGALLAAVLDVAGDERVTTWPDHPDSPFRAILETREFEVPPVHERPAVPPAVMVRSLGDDPASNEGLPPGALDGLASWDLRMVASDYY